MEILDHRRELEEAIDKLLHGGAGELARVWRRLDQIQMELIAALYEEDLLIRKAVQPVQV